MQIMLYLARSDRIIAATELSENLQISQRYILQVEAKLRKGGFVDSHAGMKGGISLTKDISTFSAYDIMNLMEGDMKIPRCASPLPGCGEPCINPGILDTFSVMKDYFDAYLKSITFDKLAGMGLKGRLSEILDLAEEQIGEMKHIG